MQIQMLNVLGMITFGSVSLTVPNVTFKYKNQTQICVLNSYASPYSYDKNVDTILGGPQQADCSCWQHFFHCLLIQTS